VLALSSVGAVSVRNVVSGRGMQQDDASRLMYDIGDTLHATVAGSERIPRAVQWLEAFPFG